MSKKLFKTRAEIERQIDAKKTQLHEIMSESEKLKAEANEMLELSANNNDYSFGEDAKDKLLSVKKLDRSAYRIEEIHLPKLKRALAAMDTQTMPFATGAGVVLE